MVAAQSVVEQTVNETAQPESIPCPFAPLESPGMQPHRLSHRLSHRIALAIVCAVLSMAAHAFYAGPETEEIPVERLIKNLEATVAIYPDNVAAVLNLARTHAMAYSQKSEVATILEGQPEFGWEPANVPVDRPVETTDPAKQKAAERHLRAALALYERAAGMAPNDLLIRLGHAWLVERSGNEPRAIQMYRDLIAREWSKLPTPRPLPPQPASSDPKVVYLEIVPSYSLDSIVPEVASYLLPLLDPVRDRQEIAELRARLRLINAPRPVSPIVVPLRSDLRAADLEDRSARVTFDADGSGQRKRWTWITTNGAWLVYQRPASIDSALQLFGNFTFWLFWANGYEALAALDDDRDGTLQAAELAALALWHDTNSNGLSEDGEVQPLAAHGIVALSYRYEHDLAHPDHIAFAPVGVVFADGRSRPTYDLLLHPR
jgi:hypothetical protein